MKTPEEIFETLKNNFPEDVLELVADLPAEKFIKVNPLAIKKISNFLRTEDGLKFDTLMCLSGVDEADGEKVKDENENEIIKDGLLSVYYHLDSIELKHKVTIKVETSRDNPEVESVENVWKCADWHEREAYDMYGIKFRDHPNLERILMPYDWDAGYPLRKDYQNPEFYKGMKVPY
ncbi:MAG: NADH-quinone oxidoreductase subunit C [Ignavibacteria bacterium]|jgi:NADH-quinone oxidoreductase subunit C